MKLNQVSEPIFTSRDLIQEIYRGNLDKLSLSKVDEHDIEYMSYLEFIEDKNLTNWPCPDAYLREFRTQKEYDSLLQSQWFMPEEYKDFDIEEYLYSLCITDQEKNRVQEELVLFKKHNMFPLLKFLKYLVDKLQEDKILWGVGRGSSVASYCLYLLRVHKVDSIKYELDIKEFLR